MVGLEGTDVYWFANDLRSLFLVATDVMLFIVVDVNLSSHARIQKTLSGGGPILTSSFFLV